ncbi:MAG: FtsX-like permease family protein, partial [Micromonosporaceae bacterium]
MGLVRRRARRARGLLAAAAVATLLATVLLTTLGLYAGQVLDSATRAAVAAAPAGERSMLVTGSGAGEAAAVLDTTVDEAAGAGLDGLPVRTARAGYAAAWQLPSGLGDAQPDADGLLYASVLFLDDLPSHARLTSGAWPRPGSGSGSGGGSGGGPVETALAEPAARQLQLKAGDQIDLTDRRTGKPRAVRVTGLWQPVQPEDPYWQLVPGVATGALPGSATYGPLVVDEADFVRHFSGLASSGWVLTPDLSRVTADRLPELRSAADALSARLERDGTLDVTTGIGTLTDRLARSTVVARSALLIPALLLIVIAGYALLLVAGLLTDQRRDENALLVARGARRRQLAGLAAAEALIVSGPAALLGAPLAVGLLRLADRAPWLAELGLRLDARLTTT